MTSTSTVCNTIAKMLEMERQLNELKKQIQSGDKQTREGHQKIQPSIKSGKRNRVAHESSKIK